MTKNFPCLFSIKRMWEAGTFGNSAFPLGLFAILVRLYRPKNPQYLKYTPIFYYWYNRERNERRKPADLHDPSTFNNSLCSLGRGAAPLKPRWGHGRIAPPGSANALHHWQLTLSWPFRYRRSLWEGYQRQHWKVYTCEAKLHGVGSIRRKEEDFIVSKISKSRSLEWPK